MASSSDSDTLRNALNLNPRRYTNLLNRFGEDGSEAREAGLELINTVANQQEQLEELQRQTATTPEPTNDILPLLQQQTSAINNLILVTQDMSSAVTTALRGTYSSASLVITSGGHVKDSRGLESPRRAMVTADDICCVTVMRLLIALVCWFSCGRMSFDCSGLLAICCCSSTSCYC